MHHALYLQTQLHALIAVSVNVFLNSHPHIGTVMLVIEYAYCRSFQCKLIIARFIISVLI